MNGLTRPDCLSGKTYKHSFHTAAGEKVSLYITINDLDGRPFEVFISSKNAQFSEHLNVLMLMVSYALRNGGSLTMMAQELEEICSPFTGHFTRGTYVGSLYAAIGGIIKSHCQQYTNES